MKQFKRFYKIGAFLLVTLFCITQSFSFPKTDFAIQDGIVRLYLFRKTCVVVPHIVHEEVSIESNKETNSTNIISTSDNASSSGLTLFVDGKKYNLKPSKKIPVFIEKTNSSLSITYNVNDIALVKVSYSITKANFEENHISNAVEVDYLIKNISQKEHSFALKVVFDTTLGEGRKSHFTTSTQENVNLEYEMNNFGADDWIISSDGQNAVRFSSKTAGRTPFSKAVLANRAVLTSANLDTTFLPGRSFNSISLYNNSAIGFFAEDVSIKPNKQSFSSLFMEFSQNDFKVSTFIKNELPQNQEEKQELKDTVVPPPTMPQNSASSTMPQNFEPSTNSHNAEVDDGYIRSLIEYIDSLEEDDAELNHEKIKALSDELDRALFEYRSSKR